MYDNFSNWQDVARSSEYTIKEQTDGSFIAHDGRDTKGWFGMDDNMEIGGYFESTIGLNDTQIQRLMI